MKASVGQIWEAASTDSARPILTGVMFDAKAATLTATDSYILARVPCEVEDGDESGLIPAEALKTAKGESLRVKGGKATLKLANGERSWTLIDGAFPDVDKILKTAPEATTRFGVNPDLLRNVALALGCGGKTYAPLVLHPVAPLKGIRVASQREGVGVLMPVRLTDNDNGAALPTAPDLGDDEVVIAAVRAAYAALDKKRGKKKAAQAFREALNGTSQAA